MFPKEGSEQLDSLCSLGLISEDLADRIFEFRSISEAEQNQAIAATANDSWYSELHDFLVNYQTFTQNVIHLVPGSSLVN